MRDLLSVRLDDRGILAISGDDAKTYLQGLISNDINRIGADRAIYAALLTPQGKYLYDFMIVASGNTLLLDTEAARLHDLKRRLSTYRLRSRVSLESRPDLQVTALLGEAAAAAIGLPAGEPGLARTFGDGVAFIDPRLAEIGGRAIVTRGGVDNALASAGFTPAEPAAYDRLRLSLGLPDGSRDMQVDKATLLECGFDELGGIDWQKGCYVGQELTARTKYRGLVKKRLMPLKVEGPPPSPGTPILADDHEIGEVRSGSGDLVLAILRLDSVRAVLATGGSYRVGEATLTPYRPAWMVI